MKTPVLESPFKGIVNLFSVTVKKYNLLQYLRKRRSLSAYVYHNTTSVYKLFS